MNRRRVAARKRHLQANISALADADAPSSEARDAELDPIEQLVTRARKLRQRGEMRRAVVTLREAANRDEWRPRTWTLLGDLLARAGQRAEAAQALRRAQWLRVRAGDEARAAVVERLARRLAAAA